MGVPTARLPPYKTVYYFCAEREADGITEAIHRLSHSSSVYRYSSAGVETWISSGYWPLSGSAHAAPRPCARALLA